MSVRWSLTCLALVLAACGGDPAPSPTTRIPHVDPPPRSGLVWTVDAEGRHRTLWVSLDGTRLSSQPIEGPLWAEGDCLWQWIEEPVEVPVWRDEPDRDRPAPDSADGTETVFRGVMRELVAGDRVVVVEAPAPGAVREVHHELRPVGSVGPYVFLRDRRTIDAWGAHGVTEVRSVAWDLRSAGEAEPLTERERAALRRVERETARRALVTEGADRGIDAQLSAERVERIALEPRWIVGEGLRVDLWYVTEACYACGDGTWGDYRLSVAVPAARTLERFEGHRRLPDWARRAAAELGDLRIAGFTRVEEPEPARVLDSLRR